MALLIDTYNVLHTTGILPAEHAGIEVDDLVALLAASRYCRHRCTLICDGTGVGRHVSSDTGDMRIVYSGPHRSADDVIIDMFTTDTAPRQLTVVTSDMTILKAARKRRCQLMRSNTLLAQLAHDVELPVRPRRTNRRHIDPLPRKEVKQWIHRFDLSDEELELLAADDRQFLLEEPAAPQQSPSDTSPPTPPMFMDGLPADLIDEAVQLSADQSSAPIRTPPKQTPTEPATPQDSDDSKHAQTDISRQQLDDLGDSDIDNIDMRDLLPDVQPLQEDEDEHD